MEELEKLKDFDFFPHQAIDIEKPSSVSKEHKLLWRLPINETLKPNEYIIETDVINQDAQDSDGRIDKEKLKYPVDIRATVRFDYHLRY
jgi:hypothetical protein